MKTCAEFFQYVYGIDKYPGSLVISAFQPGVKDGPPVEVGWSPDDFQADFRATAYSERKLNTYFGCCLQHESGKTSPKARGGISTAIAMPGIWADVDIGEKNNGKSYPPTAEAAIELLDKMPLPVSMIVNSGGGLQAWWLFKELFVFDSADERHRGAGISRAWQRMLNMKANAAGFEFDSTFDLGRVLRPVPTLNYNYTPPRPVTLLASWAERRYTIDDFTELCDDVPYDSGQSASVMIGEFTIPSAPIPESDLGAAFATCLANDAEGGFFKAVWTQSRKIGDGSPSSSAWAIARRIRAAGGSAQDVVSVCITWRHLRNCIDRKHLSAGWWKGELERVFSKVDEDKPSGAAGTKPQAEPVKLTNVFSLLHYESRKSKSGKITIGVKLLKDGQPMLMKEITSAASNQKEAIKAFAKYIAPNPTEAQDGQPAPEPIDLEAVIGKMFCESQEEFAAQAASAQGDEQVETIRQAVFRVVPPLFEPTHRTDDGKIWSEAFGRTVSRQEFTSHIPQSLVDACESCRDVRVNETTGGIDDQSLIRSIGVYLGVLWSTLMESLPAQASSEQIDAESAAAREFREAIIKIWTSLTTHQAPANGATDGLSLPARASLASRVQKDFDWAKNHGKSYRKWQEVQSAFSAWWRPYSDNEGVLKILLAMRYTLATQTRIPVPGVFDQVSLSSLGTRYRVFSDTPPVTDRMSGGQRLVVLTDAMADEILTQTSETLEIKEESQVDDFDSDASDASDTAFRDTGRIPEEQLA